MDEASRQLLGESRTPFVDEHGVTHTDYEYVRHGEQKIFLATEPLGKWRTTRATDHRTAVDWAHFVKEEVIDHYPNAEKIVLVMDNLNTHKLASFYQAYPPEEARAYTARLEVHYTPKHGSWLDMAEIELSVLQNQCLRKQRIATKQQLRAALQAWTEERNDRQSGVRWQFTTEKARTKLLKLYPTVVEG
jgi:hypothetical protein